jgi:hypothetical protein
LLAESKSSYDCPAQVLLCFFINLENCLFFGKSKEENLLSWTFKFNVVAAVSGSPSRLKELSVDKALSHELGSILF